MINMIIEVIFLILIIIINGFHFDELAPSLNSRTVFCEQPKFLRNPSTKAWRLAFF